MMPKKSAQQAQIRRARRLIREDKAASTMGRMAGRATFKQLEYLAALGVDRAKAMNWTKYRASQEIDRRRAKAR